MFKRILIDTNGIKLHDNKTGIYRTVNNIVKNLIYNNKDIEIIPFYILNNKAYVNKNLLDVFDKNNNFTHNQQIILNRNDYILIADFIAPIWENCFGFYKQAKNLDIYISAINYDLLPIKYPELMKEFSNFNLSEKFKQYIDIFFLNIVNEIICISKKVAFETEEYCKSLKKNYSTFPKISYWYLGFDFEKQISEDKNIKFFNNFYNKEYLLMVGTIEPRKNHKLAVETMTQLWSKNYNLFLIIIGKNGWTCNQLIEEIKNHKEYNKKLFYFDKIEDYELSLFYKQAKALLQLSKDEGFGLPLWEASQYGTEIICSDIPVFKEIAGEYANYVSLNNDTLTKQLEEWYSKENKLNSFDMPKFSWSESINNLIKIIFNQKINDNKINNKKIKIVIDLQGAQSKASRKRGVGRYIIELLKEFMPIAKQHEISLFVNSSYSESIEELKQIFDLKNIVIWNQENKNVSGFYGDDETRKQQEIEREQFILNLNPDIVWVPNLQEGESENCVTSVKKISSKVIWVSTIYDLIPLMCENKSYLENEKTKKWYYEKINHVKNSDYIITISNFSKQKIVELLNYNENNIFIIPPATNNKQFNNKIGENKITNQKPYILFVSGYNPHKNVISLLEACAFSFENHIKRYDIFLQKKYDLILVGKNLKENLSEQAKKLSLKNIIFKDDVNDNELLDLYKNSSLFVFPSYAEGFGIPPLEAMSCGVPTITSNSMSLPEVVGYKEAMFEPFNIEQISNLIRKSLKDNNFKENLILNGLIRSEMFSWKKGAIELLNIFETIINKK